MSGSLGSVTSLFGSASTATLLNTLIGANQTGPTGPTADPIAALKTAETTEAKGVKLAASQSEVKSAIAQFTAGVNHAKSVKQLLSNPAVMNVLLTAYGLTDQIGYTALATKVLTSKTTDPKSLVNTLTDSRWKPLAQQYHLGERGLAIIQTKSAIAAIAQKYAQAAWSTNQDTVAPGISNALAFKSQAASINSVVQILGNRTLRTVVTVALGIPAEIAFQGLTAQENAISSRLDVKKFKDPKFVEEFAQRYLIANAGNNASASSSSSSSSSITDLTSIAVKV
jgi:hypothetical protein